MTPNNSYYNPVSHKMEFFSADCTVQYSTVQVMYCQYYTSDSNDLRTGETLNLKTS